MSDQEQPVDVKKAVLLWAAGQPFNNVLLFLILGSGLWACHYTLTVAEPARLKQIQDGYERIEESNNRDRDLIIKQYDKWFDVIQKRDDGNNTGGISPIKIFEQVWSSGNEQSGIFGRQIANVGSVERNAAPSPDLEFTTEGGTVVSVRHVSDSGTAGTKLRWTGRESRRCDGRIPHSRSGGQARASGVDLLPFGRKNPSVDY